LHDFVWLKRGDAVVTNAGKSAVSEAFIKIGAMMGLRVYAVVRNKSPQDEAALLYWGAAGVFDEAEEYHKQVEASLALNQIGGESVLKLIKALRNGGTCITIGGALREPVRYPTRELIFKDVRLRGFWMDKWTTSHPAWRVRLMMNTIWRLMIKGALTQTISEEFPLQEYRRALSAAVAPGRLGKVLFVGK
jgi:NADPH:quinone reductase-like Zn-dependent oxidoreductase